MNTTCRAPAWQRCAYARPAPTNLLARSISTCHRKQSVATRVLNVTQDAFEAEVLKADKPVLVDFWADWCGPCKLVAPLMDWAEQEYGDKLKVVKVEHDANPKLIAEYKVYGLPTLVLFKDGVEVPGSKREGAVGKAKLQEWLKQYGI